VVSQDEHHEWMWTDVKKYEFPNYSVFIDGNQYSIETDFYGEIKKGHDPLPFQIVLF
jgi:hypothetical protein